MINRAEEKSFYEEGITINLLPNIRLNCDLMWKKLQYDFVRIRSIDATNYQCAHINHISENIIKINKYLDCLSIKSVIV